MHIIIEGIAHIVHAVRACVPHTQAMGVFATIDRPDGTEEAQNLRFKCCEFYQSRNAWLMSAAWSVCAFMPLTSLDYREEMLDFMFACHEVVEMIMECFARGLGLKEDFFKEVKH